MSRKVEYAGCSFYIPKARIRTKVAKLEYRDRYERRVKGRAEFDENNQLEWVSTGIDKNSLHTPTTEKEWAARFDQMNLLMDRLNVRREARLRKAIKEHGPQNGWVKKEAIEIFTMDGEECWIAKSGLWAEAERMKKEDPAIYARIYGNGLIPQPGYNGYVCFKQKPVVEPAFRGVLAYVPVHGGITYAVHDELGSVYGFDTAHAGSENHPTRDVEWIRGQIDVMVRGILVAASVEEEYLKADGNNQRRAQLIQQVADVQPSESLNFLAMVNLICGEL
jgi:hypothetical protein